MGSKWIEVKLSDLGEVARGRSRHRPRYAEHLYGGPYPFIQTGDITASGGRIISHSQTYSEAGLAQSRIWPKNTMCITIAANIAETAILQYPACFPDSVIGFIADEEKCDVYFIEYVFRCLKRNIQRQASGSVQDNINLQTLERLTFKIPDLQEQKKIASFLNQLDEKIYLNRQINQTLEQMAQTLFKSWFFDFDPVIDNALDAGNDIPDTLQERAEQRRLLRAKTDFKPLPAETHALFPSEFEETELGWVPKGWEVELSGKQIDVRDGTHDSPQKSDTGYPLVTSKHITSGILNLSEAYLISKDDYDKANQRSKVCSGDILLTMIGTVGIPYLVAQSNAEFAIKNVGLFRTSENKILRYYFFELLKSNAMQCYLDSRLAGTTQKYLSLKELRHIEFLMPNEKCLNVFNESTSIIYSKIQHNLDNITMLVDIRDSLLPKLISGELALDDLPEDVAEAAEAV